MNKSTEFSIDSVLAEARARQREKWSRAEQVSIEELLLEFPQLADNEDHLLELIYAEYCLRLRHDDPFESSEYFDRFPQVTDRLRVIFQVHAVMEESTVSPTLQSNLDDTRGISRPGTKRPSMRMNSQRLRPSWGASCHCSHHSRWTWMITS